MSSGHDDFDEHEYEDDLPVARDGRADVTYARARVKAPAVTMLVFAIISLALVVLGAVSYPTLPAAFEAQRKQIDQNPNMPAGQKQQMKDFMQVYEDSVMASLPFVLPAQALVGLLCVVGSVKMMSLSSRGWALATAVLNIASVGHNSCCCFLTLPVGIWALMTLLNDRVAAGFAAAAADRADRFAADDLYDA